MVDSKKTLLLGVGGCGMNTLQSFINDERFYCVAINTDSESLGKSAFANKLFVSRSFVQCIKNGQLTTINHAPIDETKATLSELFARHNRVVIFAGLGGIAGSSLTLAIAAFAQSQCAPVTCVVIMPFKFERYERADTAKQTLKQLENIPSVTVTIFHNDSLLDTSGALSLTDAFGKINQQIADTIEQSL